MTDETLILIEERAKAALDEAIQYEPDSKERKALNQEASILIDKLLEVNGQNLEYYDKEERRGMERDRNETMAEIEREKMDVHWKRVALEILKVAVPVLTTVISLGAYGKYQERVMEYEKDGTIRSTAGRQLGLPRILK